MCGIVGYVGHAQRRAGPARRAAAARVPRLRLGRRRRAGGNGELRHGRGRGQARATWREARRHGPGRRHAAASATPAGPPTAPPTEDNAHPHRDGSGRVVVVHNGIIENYLDAARRSSSDEGVTLRLRDRHRGPRPPDRARCIRGRPASRRCARRCRGSRACYAIAAVAASTSRSRDRRRAARAAAGRRARRGRELRRLRRPGDPAPHPRRRLPRGRRGRRGQRRRRRRCQRLDGDADRARAGAASTGTRCMAEKGGYRALHAQGDPRAAARRSATPSRGRVELEDGSVDCSTSSASSRRRAARGSRRIQHRRLRHLAGTPAWSASS